ncbi:putative motility protein [Acidilutibacter cellobiosedens]|jgi:hypothetical protein|uniref:Putative motility protein n=1 Tax=Acidilutibacter cellobiosedens TaxID=2507161 RepID=A0A410Q9M4_9FIRM|nr:YjfB family protein [Acidilutibacter cellobiosedens]QAT60695.1 putative motility protein [Acidilutibacter cellobiosedens]
MDIPSLSIALSQSKLYQEVGVSVMEMAMDSIKMQGTDLTKMMEATTKIMQQSVNPHIGGNIDISV